MAILFQDDFNRANEDLEASANWTDESAADDYKIVGNEVKSIQENSPHRVAFVSGITARADMNVTAKMKYSGAFASSPHLIARRTAIDTFYFAKALDLSNATIEKRVAGVNTLIAQAPAGSITTTYKAYRFEVFGTSLKLYEDGVLIISTTDSTISAAGFGGIMAPVSSGASDPFWDDFKILDSVGALLDIDSIIPVDYRSRIDFDSLIPVHYSFANLLRINPEIPVSYRLSAIFDIIIPILYKFPAPLNLDHVMPIIWRRLLEIDSSIPIQYSNIDPWVKQVVSEISAWINQGAGAADAWVKKAASEASTWSPT